MSQIVLVLIVANVLVSYKGFNDLLFFDRYKFQVQKILNGEKVRMLTSGFLHADWAHLGFNMYALYLFGGLVIGNFSTINFALIYLGSLLLGSMYSLYQHKHEFYYSAVGASGAVSGIMFSAIMLYPSKTYSFIFFPFIDFPAYALGIGYLVYSIYGMKKQLGNIGHSAHLGGAIGGYVLTLFLKPSVISNNPIMIGVMGLIILVMFLFGDKLKLNE
ncbi:rhomboid family intramembrane serine protease [Tenacibaculum aiptasiae]|uniref:Rhomboid family intramembrane serine protease n=1 Tax=Tenacibaculum aiptasiae TaxID=426481 RepID=A0A7J5ALL3_9FLAO|nr:rhomboid family intramembrane serine protease [Tenacibaculum aiptasiae]KAB1158358.1 rhomboid family intramembrane serine protease [Tenacibaculum aiptasiae]